MTHGDRERSLSLCDVKEGAIISELLFRECKTKKAPAPFHLLKKKKKWSGATRRAFSPFSPRMGNVIPPRWKYAQSSDWCNSKTDRSQSRPAMNTKTSDLMHFNWILCVIARFYLAKRRIVSCAFFFPRSPRASEEKWEEGKNVTTIKIVLRRKYIIYLSSIIFICLFNINREFCAHVSLRCKLAENDLLYLIYIRSTTFMLETNGSWTCLTSVLRRKRTPSNQTEGDLWNRIGNWATYLQMNTDSIDIVPSSFSFFPRPHKTNIIINKCLFFFFKTHANIKSTTR